MLTETRQTYSGGLIEEFEIRYDSLKSCDHFFVFDPSTWPQEIQDLDSFGNNCLQHSQEI